MSKRALKEHLKYKIPKLTLALIREPDIKPTAIWGPVSMEQFVEPLKHYSEEYFVSFHLDAKHQVIGYHVVSHGTISASLVHPREVFKAALLANSHAIIVAHNHPAGSLTPSSEDLETTEKLIEAGRIMGVSVLDHIIVSSNGISSLREYNPNIWND